MKNHKKINDIIKQVALERIIRLFEILEDKNYRSFHKRYIYLILKISMRYRIHLPSKYKHRFCKKCNTYLLYGSNSRVRIKKSCKLITCLSCGSIIHYPYKITNINTK